MAIGFTCNITKSFNSACKQVKVCIVVVSEAAENFSDLGNEGSSFIIEAEKMAICVATDIGQLISLARFCLKIITKSLKILSLIIYNATRG